ncbi:hypothetical protein F183_A11200 [Bryobacterales bacterium F-183]|nr:hypothetical protein F183_A11200 [Bryobacterales bacterium F-183]
MLAALVCSIAVSLLAADDWSRFRGPNGSGIATGNSSYPIEFARDRNMLWRTPVRPGKSSPVLTDRHLFLTAFDDQTLYTQCFDRATGKLLWERGEPLAHKLGTNALNHPAAISPVTDGSNVYVFFKDLGLLSYTPAGKLRWRVPLGPFTNSQGLGAAPILARDMIILQVDQLEDSYLAAFAIKDGKQRWKVAREESESWGTPLLWKGDTIVTVGANQIGGHRITDGKRVFTFPGASPSMVASPILDDANNILYAFGYGYATSLPFERLLERSDKNKDGKLSPDEYGTLNVLRAAGQYMGNRDGTVTAHEWDLWNRHVQGPSGLIALDLKPAQPKLLWRYEKGFDSVIPSPLLHAGILYSVRNGGILTAFDVRTGEVTKTARIPGALGGYAASPTFAAGHLYICSEEGKVAVLKPGPQWDLVQLNDLKEDIFATPAFSRGVIFIRTAEALYAFGLKN